MRITLMTSGMRNYTGDLGSLEFKNGFSVDDVARRDLERIGSITFIDASEHKPTLKSKSDDGETITIEVAGGGLLFDWYLDEACIAINTINNKVMKTSDGEYKCVVRNPYGELEVSFTAPKQEVKVDSSKPKLARNEDTKERKPLYERAMLEKIADEKGISGVREIAEKHDVKARSVSELIDELLEVTA